MPVDLTFHAGVETPEQYNARVAAGRGDTPEELGSMNQATSTAYGAAKAPVPAPDTAAATDTNGLTSADYEKAAKELGYDSYAAFTQDVFAKPSQSTQDFYNSAYSTAGLDAVANEINSRQNDLATATSSINENPWLHEASRVGRVRNLTNLANANIKNLQSDYKTKLTAVEDVVKKHATDLTENDKLNQLKLKHLETLAKASASDRTAATKADQATVKEENAPPKTLKAGNTVYAWNPASKQFEQQFTAATTPKTAKEFNFTPKQLLTLQTRGLDSASANGILADIKAGHDLESIRQNMKSQKLDPGLLDQVMYYVDPQHNKPSTASTVVTY
jgi:hypothetical protein